MNATAHAFVEPTLTDQVNALVTVLSRGASRFDSLFAQAHSGNVHGLKMTSVRIAEVSEGWIPAPLLRVLEDRSSLTWRLSLCAMRGPCVNPKSLSAIACTWTIERVYRNPRKPEALGGRKVIWPQERVDQIVAALEGFAVPPTMVVSGLPDLTAVWALDGAHPVRDKAAQDRAMVVIRNLARILGANGAPSEGLEDLSIPLPGTAPANPSGEWEPVRLIAFEPDRVYSIPEIEAAVSAEKE